MMSGTPQPRDARARALIESGIVTGKLALTGSAGWPDFAQTEIDLQDQPQP